MAAVADLRVQITESIIGAGIIQAAFEKLTDGLQAVAKTSIEMNSRLEQARIGFTQMLGSAQKADVFLKDMANFAAKSPFQFPDLVDASKRMLAMGFAAEQVRPLLTAVGNAVAAMGGGKAEIDRVTLALGQMQAKTKVSAEEMNQLTEAGIPGWRLLAEAMGISVGEAQKLAEQGKVSADVFINAFQTFSKNNYGDMMAAQSKTFQGAMSTIQDSLQMAIARGTVPLFESLSDVAVQISGLVSSDEFGHWVDGVSEAVRELVGLLKEQLVPALDDTRDALKQNRTEGTNGFRDIGELVDAMVRAASANLAAFARVMRDWGTVVTTAIGGVIGGWGSLSAVMDKVFRKDFAGAAKEAEKGLGDLARANEKIAESFVDMLKAGAEGTRALFGATGAARADAERLGGAFARGASGIGTSGEGGEVDAFVKFLAKRTGLSEAEARGLLDTTDLSNEYAVFKAELDGVSKAHTATTTAAKEASKATKDTGDSVQKAAVQYRDAASGIRDMVKATQEAVTALDPKSEFARLWDEYVRGARVGGLTQAEMQDRLTRLGQLQAGMAAAPLVAGAAGAVAGAAPPPYQLIFNGSVTFPLPGANDTVPQWYIDIMNQVRAEQAAQTAGRR